MTNAPESLFASTQGMPSVCNHWPGQTRCEWCGMGAKGNDPVPQYGINEDYPLLVLMAVEHDFAERSGGCASPLHAEVDAALRELWNARQNVSQGRHS